MANFMAATLNFWLIKFVEEQSLITTCVDSWKNINYTPYLLGQIIISPVQWPYIW